MIIDGGIVELSAIAEAQSFACKSELFLKSCTFEGLSIVPGRDMLGPSALTGVQALQFAWELLFGSRTLQDL